MLAATRLGRLVFGQHRVVVVPEQVWRCWSHTRLRGDAEHFRSTERGRVNPRWICVSVLALLFDECLERTPVMLATVQSCSEQLLLAAGVHRSNAPKPRVRSCRLIFVSSLTENFTTKFEINLIAVLQRVFLNARSGCLSAKNVRIFFSFAKQK